MGKLEHWVSAALTDYSGSNWKVSRERWEPAHEGGCVCGGSLLWFENTSYFSNGWRICVDGPGQQMFSEWTSDTSAGLGSHLVLPAGQLLLCALFSIPRKTWRWRWLIAQSPERRRLLQRLVHSPFTWAGGGHGERMWKGRSSVHL